MFARSVCLRYTSCCVVRTHILCLQSALSFLCTFLNNNQHLFHNTQTREMLKKLGDLSQTQIFAKIENVEVSAMLCIDFWLYTMSLLLFLSFFFCKEKANYICT